MDKKSVWVLSLIIWTAMGIFVISYLLMIKTPSELINISPKTQEIDDKLGVSPAKLHRFQDNFKNPCWMENFPRHFSYKKSYYYKHDCQQQQQVINQFNTLERMKLKRGCTHEPCQRLRCYPYFFLIGAAKCGTTDLHASLQLYHPHFIPGSRKESQFWIRRRHGITSSHKCPKSAGIAATFADYLDLYDLAALKIQNISAGTGDIGSFYHPAVTGDFTPGDMQYLWNWQSMPGNEGLSEPNVTLADELYRVAPHTKIMMILRDPVARFESHMYFTKSTMSPSLLAFQSKTYLNLFTECLRAHSLRYCAYTNGSPLIQGLYSVYLKDWLRVFPKNQVLVLHFETYKRDRQDVLSEIIRFLDLDPSLSRNQSHVIGRGVSLKAKKKERMPDVTRTLLRDFYAPFNQELSNILNDSRFNWQY